MDTIALDHGTVAVQARHLEAQARAERACETPWPVTGLVVTEPDGQPIHPAEVTKHFRQLSDAAGLPPFRLHDLRHTHATVAAGASLKELQQRLRHANFLIAADLYADLIPELSRHVRQGQPTGSPGATPIPATRLSTGRSTARQLTALG